MIKSITIKITVIVLFMTWFNSPINAQRYLFQWMNVPGSISEKLDSAYGRNDVGAGTYVHRILTDDDFEFDNDIYSYKGVGPLYPAKFILHYDKQLFFFIHRYIVTRCRL